MKLVSDFDGVWTLPGDEAGAQGAWLDRTLAEWAGETAPETAAWLATARRAVAELPTRYGWTSAGRLSAFADEDPFTRHSALLHYVLERSGADRTAAALRAAVEARGTTLDALGGRAHAEGVAEVARTRGPGVLPDAAAAGRALLDAGDDVVVVSNSGTDKLAEWFAHAGVPTVVHPARAPGALRLRGAARKFVLDPAHARPLELGAVTIDVARPNYEEALRDEQPDAVVGDVFSLDLALPLALKRAEPAFSRMRLFWLMRDYTPAWLRAEVERAAGDEVERVDGGLPAVAARLIGERARR
jgi:hypothetical protein